MQLLGNAVPNLAAMASAASGSHAIITQEEAVDILPERAVQIAKRGSAETYRNDIENVVAAAMLSVVFESLEKRSGRVIHFDRDIANRWEQLRNVIPKEFARRVQVTVPAKETTL